MLINESSYRTDFEIFEVRFKKHQILGQIHFFFNCDLNRREYIKFINLDFVDLNSPLRQLTTLLLQPDEALFPPYYNSLKKPIQLWSCIIKIKNLEFTYIWYDDDKQYPFAFPPNLYPISYNCPVVFEKRAFSF